MVRMSLDAGAAPTGVLALAALLNLAVPSPLLVLGGVVLLDSRRGSHTCLAARKAQRTTDHRVLGMSTSAAAAA